MSVTLESTSPLTNGDGHQADGDWLKSITFRKSAASSLMHAAETGDMLKFQQALTESITTQHDVKKSRQKSILSGLQVLWDGAAENPAREFLSGLEKRSQRKDLFDRLVADHGEVSADCETLSMALWALVLFGHQMDGEDLFTLWKWSVKHGQKWIESKSICDPGQGFAQLRYLEVCYLLAVSLQDLKGSPKLLKETTGLIRSSLEEATDNDGTPQAQWLPNLIDSLACLARLTLIANITDQQLWDKKSRKRGIGLLDRTLSLCSRNSIAFAGGENELPAPEELLRLMTIVDTLDHPDARALEKLLRRWVHHKPTRKKQTEWHLPEESHQSDWANLAVLRSGWNSPVDQCVILHDASMPQLDVVVNDTPLFRGSWKHQLTLNGDPVSHEKSWSCSCWFCDEEVNFIELIQEVSSTIKIIRQVILLREEHQLILNHAVHTQAVDDINYQISLPLAGAWNWEEDTATREAAFQSFDQRVRVIPISSPQSRIAKSTGRVSANDSTFTVEQSGTGRLFVSTVFDWSPKRTERPADWSPLTVAQNGNIETPDQAMGLRYRIGRDQWLLYHSLTVADVPRTVLGMHTAYETVLARFTSKGEIEPVVEVEI